MKTPRRKPGDQRPASGNLHSMGRVFSCLVTCCLLWGAAPSALSQSDDHGGHRVKLAFLYTIAKFIQRPPEAFHGPTSPLTLRVGGPDPLPNLCGLFLSWLVLEGANGEGNKTIPMAPFNTAFDDPWTNTIDAPGFLDLKYEHQSGGDCGYRTRFYYDHYNCNGSYPYVASSTGSASRVVNEDLAIGQQWGAEFDVSKKPGDHRTPIDGLEYRDDFQQVQRNYDLQPYFRYLNDHSSSSIGAAIVQDSIPLRSNLTDFRVT